MARAQQATHACAHKSYTKRISDHVATALVVYTLMLIFITSPAMESSGTSILPYFMLVVFVGMVIPGCRGMENRWKALDAGQDNEGSLEKRFAADRIILWVAALVIPVVLAVLFTVF
jgi:hypothetical protein